jgi:hypothetical protein
MESADPHAGFDGAVKRSGEESFVVLNSRVRNKGAPRQDEEEAAGENQKLDIWYTIVGPVGRGCHGPLKVCAGRHRWKLRNEGENSFHPTYKYTLPVNVTRWTGHPANGLAP